MSGVKNLVQYETGGMGAEGVPTDEKLREEGLADSNSTSESEK